MTVNLSQLSYIFTQNDYFTLKVLFGIAIVGFVLGMLQSILNCTNQRYEP